MGIFDQGTGNLGLDQVFQNLKDAAGLSSGTITSHSLLPLPWSPASGVPAPTGPPNPTNSVNSPFFPYINIDWARWNQLYPYRLLVIDSNKNNRLVGNYATNSTVKLVSYYLQGTNIISFEPLGSNWVFNLPISPQQLNISDQLAINTSATLRGIVEEHNGLKFKMISASGTMGVWPYRTSVSKPPQSPSLLQSFFGGTISALTNTVQQVAATVNTFTTGHPANKPVSTPPEFSDAGKASTGYYQAMFLQQFIEQYAEAKKDPKNAGWRLVFDIPKQNTSYVVTPMQFSWVQSAGKPMEIQYQLQFKAWRRINLQESPQVQPLQAYRVTPGLLQRILNTITQARLAMSSISAVIGAVRSDVDQVFQVVSQSALFVKDALGVIATASDLPSSIAKDFNSAIAEWTFNNQEAALTGVTTTAGAAAIASIAASMNQNNGLTGTAVQNGQLGTNAANLQQTSAAANIFNNTNANVDYLDQVPTNQLNLTTVQQNKLNQVITNASNLSVSQLKQNAEVIQNLATQLAGYFGAGSELYNFIYNLTPPPTRLSSMTISQFLILDTLYEYIQSMNILTATTQVTDNQIEDSLNYVAGLATQSNIPFTVPTSKIIVPVPYGLNIEQISARYLGDPNRWLEIATLNNLQEPYIDQNGFQLPLLSNAIGRQVVVSNNQNLYLQQTVTLMGNGQTQVSRQISSITTLPNEASFLITLTGEPNLGNFTLADNAYLQCYLPGTVNAMQKIYIPSDLPPAQLEGQVNALLPTVVQNDTDPLAQISGVDFLLDDSGDIVLDNYGNPLLSYGLTNIIQALKILFNTQLNSVISHTEYGLGVPPGSSVADFNAQDFYKQVNDQITSDPRFSAVQSLQIQVNPPNLTINVGVQITGITGVFPISFQVAA